MSASREAGLLLKDNSVSLSRGLEYLGRHATIFMATGFLFGLCLPPLAELIRPWLTALILLLLIVVLLRINYAQVITQMQAPGLLLIALVWLLVGSPVLIALGLKYIHLSPEIAAALVLWAASPPLASAPAVALLLGLDGAATILLTIGATIVFPLTLPLVGAYILDLDLGVSPLDLGLRLLIMIAGAMAAAALLSWRIGVARLQTHRLRIDGLIVIILFLFGIGVMEGAADALVESPALAITLLITVFAASAGMVALSTLLFLWTGRRTAGGIGFISGNRNFAITLGASGAWPAEFFLFFAALQFPIYLLPLLLRVAINMFGKVSQKQAKKSDQN